MHFTPTETRLLKVLSDGERHLTTELHAQLDDELQSRLNVSVHMHNIRKKLKLKGETVLCEYYFGRRYYRHVRLLASAYSGQK